MAQAMDSVIVLINSMISLIVSFGWELVLVLFRANLYV